MSIKKLGRVALSEWVQAVVRKRRVYGVQAKGDRFVYDLLTDAADLRLDHDVTVLPPKKFFQPPREALMTFDKDRGWQSALDAEPFVLFGVHPYDVAAISQMDAIFSKDPADNHYLARRRNATIVACDVQTASPNIFAGCMGTATVRDGFDVLLTLVGDTYVVESRTEAGDSLLKLARGLEEADPISLGRREQVWQDAERLLRKHNLKCKPQELPAVLEKSYDDPLWEKRAAMCYSCGSCVLVCPTCCCFDVQDDWHWDLASGTRTRKWDGCMLPNFALVAGGHNFRKRREERYRHRFYRKGKYLWDRMGFIACVGCGRCATACTTKIANPVEVYNSLLEGK